MAAIPDLVGVGGPSPGETTGSEVVDAPLGASLNASLIASQSEKPAAPEEPAPDPYAALDRDALRGAVRDRESDLAGERKNLYAARDELAATALDLRICREALTHREADLARTRAEFNALLDRHARLALEKDILDKAIGDREADLAQARHDAAAAIEQGLHRETQVKVLEAEVRALQASADRPASAALPQAAPEAEPPAQPILAESTAPPSSHWDDLKFFVKFAFNFGNPHPVGVDSVGRAQRSDGVRGGS